MVIEKSNFCSQMVKHNGLDKLGFQYWIFLPGMLFGDIKKVAAGLRGAPQVMRDWISVVLNKKMVRLYILMIKFQFLL